MANTGAVEFLIETNASDCQVSVQVNAEAATETIEPARTLVPLP